MEQCWRTPLVGEGCTRGSGYWEGYTGYYPTVVLPGPNPLNIPWLYPQIDPQIDPQNGPSDDPQNGPPDDPQNGPPDDLQMTLQTSPQIA